MEVKKQEYSKLSAYLVKIKKNLREENNNYLFIPAINETGDQQKNELIIVEKKLNELNNRKQMLKVDAKRIKHQLGLVANNLQDQINQYLTHTKINLFKQLKNGELRPDFQIKYKNRPYRVLSYSEIFIV